MGVRSKFIVANAWYDKAKFWTVIGAFVVVTDRMFVVSCSFEIKHAFQIVHVSSIDIDKIKAIRNLRKAMLPITPKVPLRIVKDLNVQ